MLDQPGGPASAAGPDTGLRGGRLASPRPGRIIAGAGSFADAAAHRLASAAGQVAFNK